MYLFSYIPMYMTNSWVYTHVLLLYTKNTRKHACLNRYFGRYLIKCPPIAQKGTVDMVVIYMVINGIIIIDMLIADIFIIGMSIYHIIEANVIIFE